MLHRKHSLLQRTDAHPHHAEGEVCARTQISITATCCQQHMQKIQQKVQKTALQIDNLSAKGHFPLIGLYIRLWIIIYCEKCKAHCHWSAQAQTIIQWKGMSTCFPEWHTKDVNTNCLSIQKDSSVSSLTIEKCRAVVFKAITGVAAGTDLWLKQNKKDIHLRNPCGKLF